jgi:hypothetical protein
MSKTSLLDKINYPADLRKLRKDELKQLAKELREELIDVVSTTGGHLGAGLGVVELTIALHYVFDTPKDKLVWDVGHQAYPHKIITGRRKNIRTLRKGGGLSGFTKRSESEYDTFGAAHSSTSISSTLGIAVAKSLSNNSNHSEMLFSNKVDQLRSQQKNFICTSFETISGFASNGAIVHYRVTNQSSKNIKGNSLYLCDSGGQYLEGTTDVTRTIAIGNP